MSNQELFAELSSAEEALKRSFTALIEAGNRYCATFPKSVKEGLPSYADAKSNAHAAYYMYATALSYILNSVETILTSLSSLAQKADKAFDTEIPVRCAALVEAYEQFSSEVLSPYFDESQRILHANENSVALSPLYLATKKLTHRTEDFFNRIFS